MDFVNTIVKNSSGDLSVIDNWSGEYEFLRNDYSCNVRCFDINFPTAEHAYQAAKTTDCNVHLDILQAESVRKARNIGRNLKLRDNWDSNKLIAMEMVLRAKFEDDSLRTKLINTGSAHLVMRTDNDVFWGADSNGFGENHLGKLLMKLRAEFQMRENFYPLNDEKNNEETIPDSSLGSKIIHAFYIQSSLNIDKFSDLDIKIAKFINLCQECSTLTVEMDELLKSINELVDNELVDDIDD